MKKSRRYLAVPVLAAVFIGTFAFLIKKSIPEKDEYNVETAALLDIEKVAVLTGKIQPRDEVDIKPQINGIIAELYKKAGEQVEQNEVIAKLMVIPEMASLSNAQSRVRLADINMKQAQTNYNREKALFDQDLVSAEEFDQVSQALAQAVEEQKGAQDALEVIRDGVSSSNAKSSSTLVRSTISGLILNVPVKVGNSVIQANTMNDGTTVATVANMKDLIFNGNVDETEVGRLHEGMSMLITIGALEDLQFNAILEYVSPKAVVENGTNQFEIKAAVTVPEEFTVRSGYSANAQIVLQKAEQVVSVPESTIVFEGDETFVYRQNGDSYEKTAVQIGLSDGVNVEIRSGLSAGDQVRGTKIIK